MSEYDKTLYSDQFNIQWNILDKRTRMIVSFSIYKTKLLKIHMRDKGQEIIVLECINYLFDELTTLVKSKIGNIQEDKTKGIITFEEANEIYWEHMVDKKSWDYKDIIKLYLFVLEACKVSGIADPGFYKKDPGRAIEGVKR